VTDLGQHNLGAAAPAELSRRVGTADEHAVDSFGGTPAAQGRPLRRTRLTICGVAVVISFLMLVLLLGAWRDDHIISAHLGTTTAEVLSAGRLRSAIAFVTPDGNTQTPKLGVLYPTNLTVGQTIDIEYATSNPDLVRVAGRDARVALEPVGSVIAVTWMIALAALLVLRRIPRRRK
jgi:hypothetical protein